ncbi:MAG: hypothetical protein ACOX9C_12280 [Kiritimatiellia bacterium]
MTTLNVCDNKRLRIGRNRSTFKQDVEAVGADLDFVRDSDLEQAPCQKDGGKRMAFHGDFHLEACLLFEAIPKTELPFFIMP